MKTNILNQYKNLLERPLPKGLETDYLDPPKGKYDIKGGNHKVKSVLQKLRDIGVEVGEGSSRVAFKVDVEASQFDKNVLKQYGYKGNMIETVVKLALNAKGIAQNRSEIQHWDLIKNTEASQFFLPILDNSTKNKGKKLDGTTLANWIQMPYAPEIENNEDFFEELRDMFGEFIEEPWDFNLDNLSKYAYTEDTEGEGGFTLFHSPDQQTRLQQFVEIMQTTGIKIGDLDRPDQWGVWNGDMRIVDYGFDQKTTQYYSGHEFATAWVSEDGDITMDKKITLKQIYLHTPKLIDFDKGLVDMVEERLKEELKNWYKSKKVPKKEQNKIRDEFIKYVTDNERAIISSRVDRIFSHNVERENLTRYGIFEPNDLYNDWFIVSHPFDNKLIDYDGLFYPHKKTSTLLQNGNIFISKSDIKNTIGVYLPDFVRSYFKE